MINASTTDVLMKKKSRIYILHVLAPTTQPNASGVSTICQFLVQYNHFLLKKRIVRPLPQEDAFPVTNTLLSTSGKRDLSALITDTERLSGRHSCFII